MAEKEKQILESFAETLPKLSELEREKLLSYGEGMAAQKELSKNEKEK